MSNQLRERAPSAVAQCRWFGSAAERQCLASLARSVSPEYYYLKQAVEALAALGIGSKVSLRSLTSHFDATDGSARQCVQIDWWICLSGGKRAILVLQK